MTVDSRQHGRTDGRTDGGGSAHWLALPRPLAPGRFLGSCAAFDFPGSFRAVSRLAFLLAGVVLAAAGAIAGEGRPAGDPRVSLAETLRPTPLLDASAGTVAIAGTVEGDAGRVVVRVTTSLGVAATTIATVDGGAFRLRYPADFPGAPPLAAGLLFIDATAGDGFHPERPGAFQAEAEVILADRARGLLPDLPSAFTNDLLDRDGRTDAASSEWPVIRALVNLYMGSRGARLAGVGRPGFDLAEPAALRWFKDNLTLYEFDHRDRDWSKPLGRRVRRTFWQAVWNRWFNGSNDHPLDGNEANRDRSNYLPYAFTNDFSDDLILYLMRLRRTVPLDDNLTEMCREGVENFLELQHREPWNFALTDRRGKRERYTAGAFRYGMFEDGTFLVEGKGWFRNHAFLDYIRGGVFNGRAVWALGEAVKADPRGPLADRAREAISLALRFCIVDAVGLGYARRTPSGGAAWYDAGEHGYLLAGMLAACSASPELPVPGPGGAMVPLREACAAALDALCDLERPGGGFDVYPNKDALAIVALADGAEVLRGHPGAGRWIATALGTARGWLAAGVDRREHPGPVPHFGLRLAPDRMTFNWRRLAPECADRNAIHFYITGHWIHALARLHAVTGDPASRERAEAMARYLCGENPWRIRLLTETGGVYNWTEDSDGDGIEDTIRQDMYPESTAFCGIGILHLLEAIGRRP